MDALERALHGAARSLHLVAALWLFGLALLILADVIGRGAFDRPVRGTTEIISNSIVSIAFLQLTHSILMGGMLRTTVLDGFVGRTSRLRLAMLTNVAGIAFFVLLAVAVWEPMWRAIEIREYQGEGGLRVPTYPVRIVIFVTSLLAALAYLSTLVKVVCTGQVPSADTEHATHG